MTTTLTSLRYQVSNSTLFLCVYKSYSHGFCLICQRFCRTFWRRYRWSKIGIWMKLRFPSWKRVKLGFLVLKDMSLRSELVKVTYYLNSQMKKILGRSWASQNQVLILEIWSRNSVPWLYLTPWNSKALLICGLVAMTISLCYYR